MLRVLAFLLGVGSLVLALYSGALSVLSGRIWIDENQLRAANPYVDQLVEIEGWLLTPGQAFLATGMATIALLATAAVLIGMAVRSTGNPT